MLKKLIAITSLLAFSSVATEASLPYIIDIAGKGGNNRNYGQISAFVPVISDESTALFGDMRVMHHLPHFKKKSIYDSKTYEINLGAGYRDAIEEDMVLGGVVYYDLRKSQIKNNLFSQLTFNTHVLSPTWQSNFNFYLPVGKKEVTKTSSEFTGKGRVINRDIFLIYSNNIVKEKPLPGVDIKISRNIPGLEDLRLGANIYYFKGNKSVTGGGIDASWAWNDNLKFEASYNYDKIRKNNILIGFRYSLHIGNKPRRSSAADLLTTRVERDLDIVTNNNSEQKQVNIKHQNFVAIYKRDLTDLATTSAAAKNLDIIDKLDNAYSQKGGLILAEEGEVFDYKQVRKLEGEDFTQKIDSAEQSSATSLAVSSIDNVVSSTTSEDDDLERQVKVFGAMRAHQKRTNSNSFYVAGQMMQTPTQYNNELRDLFDRYSKQPSGTSKVFVVDLPGYPGARIKRAGTIVLTKENGKVYAVLGTSADSTQRHAGTNKLPWTSWFSGGVNSHDTSLYEALRRETIEESGLVNISKEEFDEAISEGRFFYDQQSGTFAIVYADIAGRHGVNQFNSNLVNIRNNPNINHSMKEVSKYHRVLVSGVPGDPMNGLEQFCWTLSSIGGARSKNPHDQIYKIISADGEVLRMEYHYAQTLGDPNLKARAAILKGESKFDQ